MHSLDAAGSAEVCLQKLLHSRPRGKEYCFVVPRATHQVQLDTVARFPQRLFHFFSLLGRYGRVGISLDQKHRRFYPAGHANWRRLVNVSLTSDRASLGSLGIPVILPGTIEQFKAHVIGRLQAWRDDYAHL